jgi:hypothetical protein
MPPTSLQKHLKKAGYDLIDGPIRNHKPLQIWLKQPFNPAELYYENIQHAFQSKVKLKLEKDPGLFFDENTKSDYSFNIGLTLIKEAFQSMGLPPVDLEAYFQSGKKISISFKNTISEAVPMGNLIEYLQKADFLHLNPVLLRSANRNNLLIITGLITAEQLVVDMETDTKLTNKEILAIKKATNNKIDLSITKNKKTRMLAGQGRFPIAVKAGRIDFDKGQFSNISLLTDTRDLF